MLGVGAVRIAIVLGLIVIGILAGAALNFAPTFLAIPIALVGLAVILTRSRAEGRSPSRGEDRQRNRLGAERIEFTERDRRTLSGTLPSPGPARARTAARVVDRDPQSKRARP